eukprot:s3123_g4.t2
MAAKPRLTEEAARQLLVSAESSLDGLTPECLRAATDALNIFRGLGSVGLNGVHDSLHVVVAFHRLKAAVEQRKPEEALLLASDELEHFRADGDRRGEASMLLALAEINMDRRGARKRAEALEVALAALMTFQEIRDQRLQALTYLILTNLYSKMQMPDEAEHAAQSALCVFQALGDQMSQAKTFHGLALTMASRHRYADAAVHAEEACALFAKLGDVKMEAAELVSIGQWQLAAGKPGRAAASAEQALLLFRQIGYGKGWQAKALSVLCQALAQSGRSAAAAKVAREQGGLFREERDLAGQVASQEIAAHAHLASKHPERALSELKDAQQLIDAKGDPSQAKARLCRAEAASFLAGGDIAEAVRTLNRAVAMAKDVKDHAEEARAYRDLFDIHLDCGRFSAAGEAAARERAVAEAAEDRIREAASCVRLAVALANGGDLVKSLALAEEACDLSEAARDRRGMARALHVLSSIQRLDGNMDAALEASEKRLKLARDLGDLHLEAAAMQELAGLHRAEGNFSEARHLAMESRDLCRQSGDRHGLVNALVALTELALTAESGDLKQSLLHPSKEAVAVAGKLGDGMLRAKALYWRAHALGAVGRHPAARRIAHDAAELLTKLGDAEGRVRCLFLVAELYAAEGSKADALGVVQEVRLLAKSAGDAEAEYEVALLEEEVSRKESQPEPQATTPQPATEKPPEAAAREVPVAKTASLDPKEVLQQLLRLVKEVTSSTDEIELDTQFVDAGMDSLSGVTLVTMMSREFGMSFTPSTVFDYPSVRTLRDHLLPRAWLNLFVLPRDGAMACNGTVHEPAVQRVRGSDLSTKLFIEKCTAAARPVILLDLVPSWPAYSQWRRPNGEPNFAKLTEDFQGVTGPVVDCGHGYDIQSWDVGDYFRWAAHARQEGDALYLKDWHLVNACRSLGLQVPYEAPSYLAAPVHDWLNLYMDKATGKDDYRFAYVGVGGTRTPLHHDVLFSHSWSANICGRKHWIFYPPEVSHKLLDSLGNTAESAQPQRRTSDWQQYFPGLQEAWERRLEAFQEEGELMFVPSGWYHEVENLTMTISINHNWLNASNAPQVWHFLRSEWQSVREKIGDLQDTFDSEADFLEQCQVLMRANCGLDISDFGLHAFSPVVGWNC